MLSEVLLKGRLVVLMPMMDLMVVMRMDIRYLLFVQYPWMLIVLVLDHG